jgi:hypothetical protein
MKSRLGLVVAFTSVVFAGVGFSVPAAHAGTASAVQPMASKCAWLSAPGGGEADVCRSWYKNSDGTYYGEMQVTGASSGVYVQVEEDGEVATITSRGGSGSRGYDGFHHVYNRVCNSGCGSWW